MKRTPKEFKVGDRVLLNTRNIRFRGANCPKLEPRFIGPYTIAERVGQVSYKLALPETMKVHPVFHVELLRAYNGPDFVPPPPIHAEDGTVRHEIEQLIAVRGRGDHRQYLVRWAGYGPEWDSWEPRIYLIEDAPLAVRDFESRPFIQPQSSSGRPTTNSRRPRRKD